jgi:hypothetical protein
MDLEESAFSLVEWGDSGEDREEPFSPQNLKPFKFIL